MAKSIFCHLTVTKSCCSSVRRLQGHRKWNLEAITEHRRLIYCAESVFQKLPSAAWKLNTLRTGDADLRFYITTVQEGWCKSEFLTRACFPCTIHVIMQYIEPVSEWSCWRMFIETLPHSELTFRHRASSIQGQTFRYSPENAFYVFNQQIYFIIWCFLDGASLI